MGDSGCERTGRQTSEWSAVVHGLPRGCPSSESMFSWDDVEAEVVMYWTRLSAVVLGLMCPRGVV